MTKSSEVLRLAAEYALIGNQPPLPEAARALKYPSFDPWYIATDAGYGEAEWGEEECMALCLAAAIAESEGD